MTVKQKMERTQEVVIRVMQRCGRPMKQAELFNAVADEVAKESAALWGMAPDEFEWFVAGMRDAA